MPNNYYSFCKLHNFITKHKHGVGFVMIIAIAFLLITSFGLSFVGSGLSSLHPVSGFLNGTLPVSTPDIEAGAKIVEAFPNLTVNTPTVIIAEPNTNRLIVGSRDGLYEAFENVPNVSNADKKVFLDLRSRATAVWDAGNLWMTFHPQFLSNPNKRFVYVWYAARVEGSPVPPRKWYVVEDNVFLRLSRFDVNQDAEGNWYADKDSEFIMINSHLFGTTHYGGGLVWDDQGNLLISVGEQTNPGSAQNLSTYLQGGWLRLDVDERGGSFSHKPQRIAQDDINYGAIKVNGFNGRDPATTEDMVDQTFLNNPDKDFTGRGYFIPNDNPNWAVLYNQNGININAGDYFEEYCTVGNRNPYRITKDRETGRLWSGEIGDNTHEEINVLEANEMSVGINFGWPAKEGKLQTASTVGYVGTLKDPLLDFTREESNAIIGGYVYRGSKLPQFYGKYIAGDYAQKKIFLIDYNEDANGKVNFISKKVILNFDAGGLVTFGEDQAGELYMGRQGDDSKIYKIVPENQTSVLSPTKLSQINAFKINPATGDFTGITNLEPVNGVLPYEINVPFWSDGAEKYRFVSIPNNDDGNGIHDKATEKIIFSEHNSWQFPVGTVFIKHFELPVDETNPNLTKKIETRFIVHGQDGKYYFITYKWLDNESDAIVLYGSDDKDFPIKTALGNTSQSWHFPSREDCTQCHNEAVTGKALGFNTSQLNRLKDYSSIGGTMGNQLQTYLELNLFQGNPFTNSDIENFLALAPLDGSGSLDEKARSYLQANCAYCHQPGTGNRSDFDLRFHLSLEETRLLTALPNQSLGIPNEKIVEAGNPEASILYHRINSVDPSIMMPPLAKGKVDDRGVQLVYDWIAQIDPSTVSNPKGCLSDAHENFNYSSGSVLSGQQGGDGFSDTWTLLSGTSDIVSVENGSLSHPTWTSSGNRLSLDLKDINQNLSLSRSFGDNLAAKGEMWLSFLIRENEGSSGGVWIRPNDRQDIAIGKRWSVNFGIDNNSGSTPILKTGQTYLVLARYQFGANSTDISLWIDPDKSNFDASLPQATKSVGAIGSINRLTIHVERYNLGAYDIDEFSFSCENPLLEPSNSHVPVTGITVNEASLTLDNDTTAALSYSIEPANATNKDVVWSSADSAIATVDSNGNVLAVAPGNTTITVTTNDGGYIATTAVTVAKTDIPVTGITLAPTSLTLESGITASLSYSVEPANASNKDVIWSTADSTVATVDSNGNVLAVAQGNTTIAVTTNDGGYVATTTVTVTKTGNDLSCIFDAQEDFNYNSGSLLEGLQGGDGFSGAWTVLRTTSDIVSIGNGSLSHPSWTSSGNKLSLDLRDDRKSLLLGRNFGENLAAYGEMWIGFLMRENVSSSSGGVWIRPNGRQDIAIGKRRKSNFGIANNGGTTPVLNTGQTYLVLARYQFGATSTNVSLWIDPDKSNFDVSSPQATKSVEAIESIDHFTISVGRYNLGAYDIDALSFSCENPFVTDSRLSRILNTGKINIENGLGITNVPKLKLKSNPTSYVLKVELQNVSVNTKVHYQLFSLTGRLISQKFSTEKEDFDVSALSNGIYIITARFGESTLIQKFIKA